MCKCQFSGCTCKKEQPVTDEQFQAAIATLARAAKDQRLLYKGLGSAMSGPEWQSYSLKPLPVGPDEVYVVVYKDLSMNVRDTLQGAKVAAYGGMQVVRYIRAPE